MNTADQHSLMKQRFRGYMPVVIDVETGGFNARTDALLEIAAVTLKFNDAEQLVPDQTIHFHVEPFADANIEQAAIEFNGIDPFHPLRGAVPEAEVLRETFKLIRKAQKDAGCQRCVLVGHNATFDHNFLMAAIERENIKRNPFHPFVTFDTTALAALTLGQTVLVKACQAAGIAFDSKQAHSALYDTERTAELFCWMVNKWQALGGWPIHSSTSETDSETADDEHKKSPND